MSLAITMAKRSARGDPGWLGDLLGGAVKAVGGAVGGFLKGGPVGAITGAVGSLIHPSAGKAGIAQANAPVGVTTGGKQLLAPVTLSGFTSTGGTGGPGNPGSSLIHHPIERLMHETTFTDQPPPGGGYHPNKGRYWSEKLGRAVQPGEIWVKNRRRNPLNPRAASRAIRRLKSAHKATRAINRFFGK